MNDVGGARNLPGSAGARIDSGDGRDPTISEDLDYIVRSCVHEFMQLGSRALLLTGGSGFVGRYIAEAIMRFNDSRSAGKCELALLTRDPRTLEKRYARQVGAGDVTILKWDRSDDGEMANRGWDYIIHGASPADPRAIMRDRHGSLRDMVAIAASVASAAKASRRVVLISSGAVYGDQPSNMAEISEGYRGGPDIADVNSAYGEGKRISEMIFRTADIDHRTARVFSVVGPYQDLRSSFAVPDLIRQAAQNGRIELRSDGRAVRSYCYAADVAAFLFKLLLGQPRHDVYNVGNRDGTISVGELAEVISGIFGGVVIKQRQRAVRSPAPPMRYVPQLDRMYEFYPPRIGIREGIRRTCQSLYSRGLIRLPPTGE